MLLALVTLLFCQRLEVPKRVCHPEDTVVLRVVMADGNPGVGRMVRLRRADGSFEDVGVADAAGQVEFVPKEPGSLEFRVELPGGPAIIALYDVVPRPRRWLFALVLTPLGLLLIWWNAGKWRRAELGGA